MLFCYLTNCFEQKPKTDYEKNLEKLRSRFGKKEKKPYAITITVDPSNDTMIEYSQTNCPWLKTKVAKEHTLKALQHTINVLNKEKKT